MISKPGIELASAWSLSIKITNLLVRICFVRPGLNLDEARKD